MNFGGLDGLTIGYTLDVREYSFLQCSIAYLPGNNQGLLVILEGLVILPLAGIHQADVAEGGRGTEVGEGRGIQTCLRLVNSMS